MKTLAKTPGRRVYPQPEGSGFIMQEPGDYWKAEDGTWYAITPNGLLGWLKNHHVEEHEDGTISVVSGPWGSNSILVSNETGDALEKAGRDATKHRWHGAIVRGEWREF